MFSVLCIFFHAHLHAESGYGRSCRYGIFLVFAPRRRSGSTNSERTRDDDVWSTPATKRERRHARLPRSCNYASCTNPLAMAVCLWMKAARRGALRERAWDRRKHERIKNEAMIKGWTLPCVGSGKEKHMQMFWGVANATPDKNIISIKRERESFLLKREQQAISNSINRRWRRVVGF